MKNYVIIFIEIRRISDQKNAFNKNSWVIENYQTSVWVK